MKREAPASACTTSAKSGGHSSIRTLQCKVAWAGSDSDLQCASIRLTPAEALCGITSH